MFLAFPLCFVIIVSPSRIVTMSFSLRTKIYTHSQDLPSGIMNNYSLLLTKIPVYVKI